MDGFYVVIDLGSTPAVSRGLFLLVVTYSFALPSHLFVQHLSGIRLQIHWLLTGTYISGNTNVYFYVRIGLKIIRSPTA